MIGVRKRGKHMYNEEETKIEVSKKVNEMEITGIIVIFFDAT